MKFTPLNVVEGGERDESYGNTAELIKAIRIGFDAVASKFIAPDGNTVDYDALKDSSEWKELLLKCHQLTYVDLHGLNSRERLCFFINLYNIMNLHGMLTYGEPDGWIDRLRYYANCSYVVGGLKFTLDNIEHGMLRGNKRVPFYMKNLSSTDPRTKFRIHPMDPRVHFAINCGAKSCPPIRVYTVDKLDDQLDRAARGYMAQYTEVDEDKHSIKTTLVHWLYQGDFSDKVGRKRNMDGAMAWSLAYLSDETKEKVERMLQRKKKSIKYLYFDYDWTSNSSKNKLNDTSARC